MVNSWQDRKNLQEIVGEAIEMVTALGDYGREEARGFGKRTCIAEKAVYELVNDRLSKKYDNFVLLAEGMPTKGDPTAEIKVNLDPLDGTLYYVRNRSASPIPVSIALSLTTGEKYQDIVAGTIGNIYSGEIWSAGRKTNTVSNMVGACNCGGNKEHNPLIMFDFYFPANSRARLALEHPINPLWDKFESLNTGSAAEMMAKVACGEADAFVNLGGLSVYEMTAGYLIMKQAGVSVISAENGLGLGGQNINGGRTPIIAAKNAEMAQKIYSQVKNCF